MEDLIINKVTSSGLITLDLEEIIPFDSLIILDMKDFLFEDIILKEADFRERIKAIDTAKFKNKYVAVITSVDAIIPTWAYMLLSITLSEHAKNVFIAKNLDNASELLCLNTIEHLDMSPYKNERVIVKGCGKKNIDINVFALLASKLKSVAKSVMYGEPCSTVPLFKISNTKN